MTVTPATPPVGSLPPDCRRCWLRLANREVEVHDEHSEEGEWQWQLRASILCALFAVAGWASADLPYIALVFQLGAYTAGAWYAVGETCEKLRRGEIDVHFLMLAVAAGAAAIGEWTEGAVLLFLFSLAGALEHFAMERTHREIRSLFHAAPKVATILDAAGQETEIAVDQLSPGMILLVKPGSTFPVDATVVSGETAADESNLTGEAVPVSKAPGDTVLAGTLNSWGAVQVRTLRVAQESALQKIIRLIQDAQRQKAPSQRFTDKFGSTYTLSILTLTATMFFWWWLVRDLAPFASTAAEASAFYLSMTLLVVASPCALVLSIPSAILAAIAWGARRGVLFRGGVAVEQLAQLEVVAMDKTGTLTTGELKVESVQSFPPGQEDKIAELAYSLEKLSSHPLARAITAYGQRRGLAGLPLDGFTSITGKGLEASLEGKQVRLGRVNWVSEIAGDKLAPAAEGEFGVSEVWVAGPDLLGRIVLRDEIRKSAGDVVSQIQARGLHLLVLTGDRESSAEFLRQQLGIKDVRAGLGPDEKLDVIAEYTRTGKRVAMIGDGVNDAPSLAAAHVGVAMGARGSDAALEQADVVLMHDRLENFLSAYDLSCRARTVIRQNLALSLGVIMVLVSFAMFGRIPLTLGVLGHEGSTVIVVLNSLRLLFSR